MTDQVLKELYIQEQVHEIGNTLSIDSVKQIRYTISHLVEKHNTLLTILETMEIINKNRFTRLKVNIRTRRILRGL
jgi:hypothetical protein